MSWDDSSKARHKRTLKYQSMRLSGHTNIPSFTVCSLHWTQVRVFYPKMRVRWLDGNVWNPLHTFLTSESRRRRSTTAFSWYTQVDKHCHSFELFPSFFPLFFFYFRQFLCVKQERYYEILQRDTVQKHVCCYPCVHESSCPAPLSDCRLLIQTLTVINVFGLSIRHLHLIRRLWSHLLTTVNFGLFWACR